MDRKLLLFSVLGSVALVVGLLWPLAYGGVPTTHDMGQWYVPMRAFYARCLEHGDAFDWIPDVFCGYYLQGDGQTGMYHPLHWLLYRFLPLGPAVTVEMVIGFPLLALGSFALLRRWRIRPGAAAFGGLVVAFSGYGMRHFEHLNATQVLAHVPWLLVLVDVALRGRSERAARNAAIGVGLLTTSELLIGYPQYFWFSAFAEGAYVLCVLPSRPALRRLAWLGGAKALGVLGGAVQLLPTADLLSTSVREAMSRADRSQWPWHPFELLGLCAPYLFWQSTLSAFYPGVVSLVLVTWLVVRRGARPRRAVVLGALAVGVLAAWLALGAYGLLYLLHLELPVIGVFRMPYRYLSITGLAVGLLAAVAIHELARRRVERPRAGRFLFVLPVLGVLGFAVVAAIDATDTAWYVERHRGSYALAVAGIAALAFTAWLVHRIEAGARGLIPVLALLAAVDLGAWGFGFVYRGGAPVTLEQYAAAVPAPPDREGRVLAAVANQLVFLEVPTPGGYMPLLPDAPLLDEIDEYGPRSEPHLRVAGVHWIQDEETGHRWNQQSWTYADLLAQNRTWTEVADPAPRVRLVAAAVAAADPVAATGTVDVARVAVVDSELELDPGPPGRAELLEDRPGRIAVGVEAPGRQLLVVSERARPGWRVRVDGVEQALVRSYGTFLGCVVGPSARRVEFSFEPRSLARGRLVSIAGVGLLLLLVAWTNVALRSPGGHQGC